MADGRDAEEAPRFCRIQRLRGAGAAYRPPHQAEQDRVSVALGSDV